MTVDVRETIEQQVVRHNRGEAIYLDDIESFVTELIEALELSWKEHGETKEELEEAEETIGQLREDGGE